MKIVKVKEIKEYIKLLISYFDAYGIYGLILFLKVVHGFSDKISLPELKYPVIVRKNTSDKYVFWQVFIEKEYDIEFDILPNVIIDAGANTGISAVFFSVKYPNAKIISIEPEENNFKLLVENTKHYKNVICLHKALSNHSNQEMQIVSEGFGEWGFTTKMVEEPDRKPEIQIVQSISVDDIMNLQNLETIDIFKIDIEGAEKELFESNYEKWLQKTRYIIIEFHDRMKNGCEATFKKTISEYNFTSFRKGENHIFTSSEMD